MLIIRPQNTIDMQNQNIIKGVVLDPAGMIEIACACIHTHLK